MGGKRGKKGQGDAINELYNQAYKLNSECHKMFKEAKKPEEVKVFIDEAEFSGADAKRFA